MHEYLFDFVERKAEKEVAKIFFGERWQLLNYLQTNLRRESGQIFNKHFGQEIIEVSLIELVYLLVCRQINAEICDEESIS